MAKELIRLGGASGFNLEGRHALSMRSLVVALNPSIDVEWRVDQVRWEEKNNVHSERRWAGGKGINVARWLKHLGGQPLLLLPLGGKSGHELAGYLRGEKIVSRTIRLRQSTRANVIITTRAGRQMRFNPLGPQLLRPEWSEVLKRVEQDLHLLQKEAGWARHSVRAGVQQPRNDAHGVTRPAIGLLILSGSLPRGVPVTAYAQLIRLAHRFGVKTLLDCDGPAFGAAIKAHPFLVKPNEHELAQWWGKPLRSQAELLRAARALSEQTRGWVLVSRGAEGATLINQLEDCSVTARTPRVKVHNTVGAGDALLAAVASELGLHSPPKEWLRGGVAVGTAAVQCVAGQLPKLVAARRLAARVEVTDDRMRDS